MTVLKQLGIYLVLASCCIACVVPKKETFQSNESPKKFKTYFELLNDATEKLQGAHAIDMKQSEKTVEMFKVLINRIFQPFLWRINSGPNVGHGTPVTPGIESIVDNSEELLSLKDKFTSFFNRLNTTSTCINDTGRLVEGLLESKTWAIQFFDATGKPGPALTKLHLHFVGDYGQCIAANAPSTGNADKNQDGDFRGNYCVISFLTEIPFLAPALGACLPSTCSPDEVSSLVNDALHYFTLQPPIVGTNTQCLTNETEVTAATIFAIVILSLSGILMLLGTIYDILRDTDDSKSENESITARISPRIRHNTSYESISSISEKDWGKSPTNGDSSFFDRWRYNPTSFRSEDSSKLAKILLSFSVLSNGKKILSTSQSTGTLGAIHGIRFISMCWVVLGHTYASVLTFTTNGLEDMPDLLKRWTFLPIVNALVSVDSFFTLSGLLTSYLTIQEMAKRSTWKINWPMFYFHRFWRLTPPYMFAIVIYLGLGQYMGSGPLWGNQQPYDKEFCEDNWWTNFLYINNLVKYKETCFGHAWYLANDMQFFILSPLVLIPFYFSRLTGMLSCLMFLFVSWTTTGSLSTSHKWPTTTISLKPVPGQASLGEWMEDYYVTPWCRIGPFIVGVIAGYCLALTEGKPFRMNRLLVGMGWVTAVASGLAIVYGVRGDITGDNPSTQGAASFYNAVGRSVWGACICWVVIACSAGYGGPVNKLLSWSPFVVLGRLTYMVYLIHPNLISVFFSNLGALFYLNDITIVTVYLGVLVIANTIAFVCVLTFESPLLGIEKAFIRKGRNDG